MAKEKTEPVEAAPEVVKLVDVNTGVEVAPVPDGFDAHIERSGLGGPCKDC